MSTKTSNPATIFVLLATFALGMCVSVNGAASQPLGSEFRVNTYTPSNQTQPQIAFDGSGNAIIVWSSLGQDGDGCGVYAQRYDVATLPIGVEFLVNTTTAGDQYNPDVSANSSDEFVVAWWDGWSNVSFQMYRYTGAPAGNETDIGPDCQYPPSVVLTDAGEFVIVSAVPWIGNGIGLLMLHGFDNEGQPCEPTWSKGIDQYSWFSAAGNCAGDVVCLFPLLGERQVATAQVCGAIDPNVPVSGQRLSAVAMRDTGDFVLAWQTYLETGDVVAQRYDAAGSPVGGQLTVKSNIFARTAGCDVAVLDNGDFLVVWDELDGGPYEARDVNARRYSEAQGGFLDEFRVNENSDHNQRTPVVAASKDGRFLVAWNQVEGDPVNGWESDVYARCVQPIATGVGNQPTAVPSHRLTQIYPNPFSQKTAIGYELANPADVTIRIFDVQGRLVTSIQQGHRPGGSYTAEWNGRDSHGRLVSSGTYFCQMTAGEKVFAKKMLVLR